MKDFINKLYKKHALIYKVLLFIATTFLIVYLFPKSGKFKYSFQKGKLWQSENLYAPFGFAIKKTNEELELEKKAITDNASIYFDVVTQTVLEVTSNYGLQFNSVFSDSLIVNTREDLFKQGKEILIKLYTYGVLGEEYNYSANKQIVVLVDRKQTKVTNYSNFITQNGIRLFLEQEIIDHDLSNFSPQYLSLFFDIIKSNVLLNKSITDNSLQEELEKISLEVGKPIKAMLAQKTKTIHDGFKALGKPCAIEYKYDGFRLIIHKKGNEISFFTRSLENVTKQFPEVVEYVKKHVKGKSFILDSEAVGFDKKTHEYKPFQSISQRIRRKYNIDKLKEELPVEINVFDILYYNGKSLLNEPFEKRTALIRKIIRNEKYKIICSKQIITGNENRAEMFYKKALEDNQEGVMMKNLKSEYNPGSRVGHMLKVKPEERDLDLVIVGAEYGTGKRSGWMSSFILACRDGEKFLEVGKVGTGIKEKSSSGSENSEKITFDELTKKLTPLIIKEKGKSVTLKPKIIVSITYQEIQKSPNYNSGFALRFPRFTALRTDKPLSEITTLKEIKEDLEKQKRNYRYG